MFAGGWDTIDDGHGIQRQRNDVVISNDTRKQQLTTRNLSLFLLVLASYYITERDHGLRLLVCIVVMVSESVMVDDCRKCPAMVSASHQKPQRRVTIKIFLLRDSLTFIF